MEEDPALRGRCGYEYVDAGAGACVDGSLHAGTRAWLGVMNDPESRRETDDSTPLVTCPDLKTRLGQLMRL